MDILRFITAGSVDDGKSTLIGRLLYDTKNIKSDIIQSVSNKGEGGADINLAYITDGLRAERQQGITIDVAYKYFTTKNRKYIITDAPGHAQYTKNLVTGASGVDAIIILIDAQNGITEQTRRHSLVASFLKIDHVVVAVNKMDLAGYDERVFTAIKNEYLEIAQKLQLHNITFIPMSALHGDNVSFPSENMKWYSGKTFEQFLEDCTPAKLNGAIMRFSVQYVVNEGEDELVFGKLVSGKLKLNDVVSVLPQSNDGVITEIMNGGTNVKEAAAGQNLRVRIAVDKKISRGDMISLNDSIPKLGKNIKATLCWLDTNKPLQVGQEYFLRINSLETICKITEVAYKIDVNSFEKINDKTPIEVNQFAKVTIETAGTIAYDPYNVLSETGRGIIIDTVTNYTSGAFTIDK